MNRLSLLAEIAALEASLERMDEADPDEIDSEEYEATLARLVALRDEASGE